MAKVIGIMGASESGKTTSMRNLDPSVTFYIDCDKKGLSWKNWKEQYQEEKHNYFRTDLPSTVLNLLQKIQDQENMRHIQTIVIDTINGIMVGEEMRNIKVNGYGKWTDLASYIYGIVDYALTMREDLTVIILCHSETISDDNGYVFTRIKTNGRKLDKIVLESKLATVLYAVQHDGKYVFKTHADNSTAKTPYGAFEADEIENDIVKVLETLQEY